MNNLINIKKNEEKDFMIIVDPDLCKGCDICIVSCPREAYAKSEDLNKKGVYLPYLEKEDKCRKCHLCELLCPDQAVTVEDEVD